MGVVRFERDRVLTLFRQLSPKDQATMLEVLEAVAKASVMRKNRRLAKRRAHQGKSIGKR